MKLLVTILAVFVLFSGCIEDQQEIGAEVKAYKETALQSGLAIADIVNNPGNYKNKEVEVSGKVVTGLAFEFVTEQPYQILQQETMIWVITKDIAPKEGSFITVRGQVAAPYQIKGRSYELAIIERERK